MRKRKKAAAVGVFISSLAVLISAIGIIYGGTVPLFLASLAVFSVTISIYASIRNKEKDGDAAESDNDRDNR